MLTNISIKQLREIRGFSQEYMALKLQISQPAYCKIENGKSCTKEINYQVISEILEVNVEYIRVNQIPVFFFIDDHKMKLEMCNQSNSDYIKLLIDNIAEQRKLMDKIFENSFNSKL